MRASSSHVHGCTFDEPRNALAHPEHRDVRRARHLGCVSLVTLFSQEKRVTRSAEGRAEALHLNDNQKQGKELDSGFRRNDEQGQTSGTQRAGFRLPPE
jgi:hypothetical protein